MNNFLILVVVLFVGANSLPVDEISPRWSAVPNDLGRMQLVDMNQVEVETEPFFNPMTDIVYLLFTRRNPNVGQRITNDMDTVRNSDWNPNASTRFIIHGWNSNQDTGMNIFMREQFLANGDHNVVVVDWSAGAQTINYISARNRVGPTGGAVALLIDDLHRSGLIRFENTIVIGHSLGAHVAGNCGKQVTRGRLSAIFGTDPAGPLFSASSTDRLMPTDAVYTEALHTNGGNLGFGEPITQASFYPNWGSSQPGCGLDLTGACAHERSNLFYSESIRAGQFLARQCSGFQQISSRNCPGIGTGIMGGDAPKNLSGVFFVSTNSGAPFAQA